MVSRSQVILSFESLKDVERNEERESGRVRQVTERVSSGEGLMRSKSELRKGFASSDGPELSPHTR